MFIKRAGLTLKGAAESIEMSPYGFTQALDNNTLKVRDLEALCKVLSISVTDIMGEPAEEAQPVKKRRYIEQRIEEIETEVRGCEQRVGGRMKELEAKLIELDREIKGLNSK